MWARAAAVAVAVLALGLVPWSDNPLYRLAGAGGDGPEPRFDVPLDPGALEDAAETMQPEALYATSAPQASPLAQGNLKAAGQLYLWRQLPVLDVERASVVFTYRDGVVVPLAGE